jgi:hypothetical protein
MVTQFGQRNAIIQTYEYSGKVIYLYCIVLSHMSESSNTKYLVSVKQVEKSIKLTDEAKTELQSFGMMDEKGKLKLKGVSPKMLKRMKLEAVDCPVLNREVGFIQCYACKNFHSRITGQVYCKGEPL